MFWIRGVLILLWCAVGFLLMIVVGIFHWKDPRMNFWMGKYFTPPVRWLAGIRVRAEGLEQRPSPDQPVVYVSNHQSMMDLATVGSLCPINVAFVGKFEILLIPLLNVLALACNQIMIKRHDRGHALRGMQVAVERIAQERVSVWMFPEGTRNKTTDPLIPFKKGAFYLAIAAQVPVVPIVSGPLWPLYSWPERRMRSGEIGVRVLPAIPTEGLGGGDVEALMERVAQVMREAVLDLPTHVDRQTPGA